MLIIDKQTRGRHGNKVFHFNTLMQLSQIIKQDTKTDNWDCYDHFEKTCKLLENVPSSVEIPFEDLIYKDHQSLFDKYSSGDWRLHTLSLCGPFSRITTVDPRKFIKLNNKPQLPDNGNVNVGIHIRGGDLRVPIESHRREIHPPDYYIKSIDFVLNHYKGKVNFFLCTDDPDPKYPSYSDTLNYIKKLGTNLYHDPSRHYMVDFAILSECDVLISGSSTFVMAAAIIGKKKRIIHSKDFVLQFKEEDQKWYSSFGNGMFFYDLNNRKSPFYNLWKLI